MKFAVVVLISACLLPAFCSPVHEASPIHVQQSCNYNKWCPAGAYCNSQSETPRCFPCPPRTYQPPPKHLVERCIQHSVCAPSPLNHDDQDGRTGRVIREGNRTHDTVCECEAGKYWMERGCREVTKCAVGEGVANIATPMYNTECTPCRPGTFSDEVSATQVCDLCTDCMAESRTTLEPCTPAQDTVCGAVLITQTEPGDVDNTSPKEDPSSVPPEEPDKGDTTVTTAETTGGKSPLLLPPASQIARIAGPVAGVACVIAIIAVTIFCVCKKRRRKAANNRPDPEGGPEQVELMTGPGGGGEDVGAEEDNGEDEDDEETFPKKAVAAARRPLQDTNDPKNNERDLSLKETNDGLEELPDGAEGATSLKDARAPVQDLNDPEGNERDLHTKDATYAVQELTSDGDITVRTSYRGISDEDLYKGTSV